MARLRAVPWVLGLCAAGLVVALGGGQDPPAPPPDRYAVPDAMAGYSHLTGTVSSSPPGQAVALFQHGYGVELLDVPQAVVLGASGDVYRRVDVAEARHGGETQGDPAPMLLSPDGRYVAVGDHVTDDPDVAVVDLTDGTTSTYSLPRGRSVVPLAWTADGGSLALLLSPEPTNPYSGGRITGAVGILDLTDRTTDVVVEEDAAAVAFSPDGGSLAVERYVDGQSEVWVVDGDGRERAVEADGRLAGPSAWSPEGRLLAITTVERSGPPDVGDSAVPTGLSFVDPSGAGGAVPDPLPLELSGPGRVLAWNGDDEVVLLLDQESADACCGPESAVLSSVPLDGSAPGTLMEVGDLDSYGVGRFQLAADAGGRLQTVAAGDADRGPWPWPWRVGAAVVAGLLVWLVTSLALRVASRGAQRSRQR